jgi:hypothetical protein
MENQIAVNPDTLGELFGLMLHMITGCRFEERPVATTGAVGGMAWLAVKINRPGEPGDFLWDRLFGPPEQ